MATVEDNSTSLQQRIGLTGLTCHTAFLYEMLYLTSRRRVNPGLEGKTKCNALGSFFPFSVEDGERRL